jgi:hypothetical protein
MTTCQHPAEDPSPTVRKKRVRPIPRYALTKQEAADSIGISIDSFERYVQSHLRLIRIGGLVLVPASELRGWVDENAARTLD